MTYTCPMHSDVVSDSAGQCPECGMNLVPAKKKIAKHDHLAMPDKSARSADRHAGHSTNIFKQKFWISLALTIIVVLYSPLPQAFLNWQPPVFFGSQFLPLMLGSVVFFYGGWIFVSSAWRELQGRQPGMMALISLAILTAYSYSVWQVVRGVTDTLFWELTTLITIMLLGHWLEMRAVRSAQGALHELSKLLPDTAEVISGGQSKTVPLEQLRVGDVIVVRPGGKIAADGEIVAGTSDINESVATGESKPVAKHEGDIVIAGTINGDGSLKVKVTKIGQDTFLAGVMRLVQEAQASKSKLQLLSDRAAFYLTVIAVVSGIVAFAAWFIIRANPDFALERLVAVLVVACPHALGLAIPLVASISTTMAARNGFLIRERLALEAARDIDIVLFDKTGTLTQGAYGLEKVWSVGAKDEREVLQLAASVDAPAEHFIAQAIVQKAKDGGLPLLDVKNFTALKGKGVQGVVAGRNILAGGRALLRDAGITVPAEFVAAIDAETKRGQTVIYVLENAKLLGMLALGDVVRQESRQAIERLKGMDVAVAMITGDSANVAQWVAKELGIDQYFAEVLPEHKADKVKELQQQGKKVAMVGDGINDAPALTQADVGIAIGAGTNVAIESAGIVLVKNDPRDIPKIITLSRLTYAKMIQNLWWATGYNIVALPLAAGVAVAWGVVLNPALAAVFMSLSTVIVAMNAVLLRRQPLTTS